MGGDNDSHRTIHARQFFDNDRVFDVAQPRAAVLFREDGAHIAELPQLLDYRQRKRLRLVPLHDVRRDFSRREFPHFAPKLDLLGRVFKVH